MAVWDVQRATVDIDLLVEETDVEAVKAVAASGAMSTRLCRCISRTDAIDIRRISKTGSASGDVLMLGILLVTPQIRDVWDSRQRLERERGTITVVSRRGLAKLKWFRGSGRDLDDIDRLRGES
jgi:hypothetical protein